MHFCPITILQESVRIDFAAAAFLRRREGKVEGMAITVATGKMLDIGSSFESTHGV
jgi:hypothetical protein